jgi:hypothetical protein
MIRKWHRVPGEFTQEFAFYDGAFRLPCGTEIGELLGPSSMILHKDSEDEETFEFVVSFTSSGYYDPGRVSGPPEDCYPPEGDDEREMSGVKVVWMGISGESRKLDLSESEAQDVFDHFITEIGEVEIDEDYDVGDY